MDANQFFHTVIRSFSANNLAPSVARSKYFVAWVPETGAAQYRSASNLT
jgi:hypothetical protein